MQIFVNTKYDFVKYRFHAVAFSLIWIAIGAGFYLKNGINWGIDFSGGANIILKFQGDPPISRLRSEFVDATIQPYDKPAAHAVLIRLPELHRETDYAGQVVAKLDRDLNGNTGKFDLNYQGRDSLTDLLTQADPDNKGTRPDARQYYATIAQNVVSKRSELGVFTNMQQVVSAPGVTVGVANILQSKCFLGAFNVYDQETVGPQVGRELQMKAVWAVVLSTLAMGVYLWMRFDLMFGVAAIVCIIHDVCVSIAFLGMINGELSLDIVAALLLIVGYSINDTVVTYDRVRENRRKLKTRATLAEQLNLAMNQTLSRTILTSGSVVIVLIALIIFGGKVIHEFAWVLLIGVIAGTYSTVTIVPAVAIAWNNMTGKKHDIAGPAARPKNIEEAARPEQRKRKAV
ncbi:MAG TPA: protein translocase subunit SecF [Thermoanaerobaculia bacterium]|nr:protein translocase subunit SecF [Thermoanaerobaculia bacterium]